MMVTMQHAGLVVELLERQPPRVQLDEIAAVRGAELVRCGSCCAGVTYFFRPIRCRQVNLRDNYLSGSIPSGLFNTSLQG